MLKDRSEGEICSLGEHISYAGEKVRCAECTHRTTISYAEEKVSCAESTHMTTIFVYHNGIASGGGRRSHGNPLQRTADIERI